MAEVKAMTSEIDIEVFRRDVRVFNLFKKKPVELSYETVAGWMLVLPAKHADNSLINQVYSVAERKQLIKMFDAKNLDYMIMERPSIEGDNVELLFDAQPASMREKFFSDTNCLNNLPQDVREYEFFSRL